MAVVVSIKVLFFGAVAERMEARERWVDTPHGTLTLGQLKAALAEGAPEVAAALAPPTRAAIDQVLATDDACVVAGQDVAFFPVFSGG